MPRGDGTGPAGMGSMTGRAAGYCSGSAVAGYANASQGGAFGMGFGGRRRGWGTEWGGGRGWRRMFCVGSHPGRLRFGAYGTPYQTPDPEMEKRTLKNQAEAMQSQLDFIKKRLGELEREPKAA